MLTGTRTLLLLISLSSLSTGAVERYSPAEKALMKDALSVLEGREKQCVVSFIQGYEFYTHPHCIQYNKDKDFAVRAI